MKAVANNSIKEAHSRSRAIEPRLFYLRFHITMCLRTVWLFWLLLIHVCPYHGYKKEMWLLSIPFVLIFMLNFIFEPNGQRARKNAPAFGILQIYSFFSIYKDMSLLLLKHSETLCLTVCTSSLVRYGKQGTIGKTNQLSKNKKWR